MIPLFRINDETFCFANIASITLVKKDYSTLYFKGRHPSGFSFKIYFNNGRVETVQERVGEFMNWEVRPYSEPWDKANEKITKLREFLVFNWGKYHYLKQS